MKIIVLAGGLSTERDVSLSSAAGICRTLLEKGHDAYLLDVFLGLENPPEHLEDVFTLPGHGLEIARNIGTEEPDLEAVASRPDQSDCFLGPNVIELCRMADITFLGLHGGEGENGKLQATFDLLGIRYTGPDSLGCAVAMDKGLTKQVFLQSGVDTPDGVCLHKDAADRSLSALGLSLPVVVKPCSGGSSIGVYIVNTEDEYKERWRTLSAMRMKWSSRRTSKAVSLPAVSLTARLFRRSRSSPRPASSTMPTSTRTEPQRKSALQISRRKSPTA